MSKSINQVVLMGRLTRDVEVRATPTGKNVASFTLAVDKEGKDDGAHFIDITAWEKLADLAAQYIRKGSKVCVTGSLNQQTWEQDGNKRSKITVTARDITFLDSKSDAAPATKKDNVNNDVGDEPINLDDIPF